MGNLFFRWLLIPMVNRLKEEAAVASAYPNSAEKFNSFSCASSLPTCSSAAAAGASILNVWFPRDGNCRDFASIDHSAATSPKSVNTSATSSDSRLIGPLSTGTAQPQQQPFTGSRWQRVSESAGQKHLDDAVVRFVQSKSCAPDSTANVKREPFLCEELLRGVCDKADMCELFHIETMFVPELDSDVDSNACHSPDDRKNSPVNYYWQFRVPPEWSSQPGFEYIPNLEIESITSDLWLSFDCTEEEALEKAFVEPSNDSFIFQVDLRYSYIVYRMHI